MSRESEQLLEAAYLAAQAGKRSEARDLVLQAIERDPEDHRAWLWLAHLSNSPRARQDYVAQAERLRPDDPAVHRARDWAEQHPANKTTPPQAIRARSSPKPAPQRPKPRRRTAAHSEGASVGRASSLSMARPASPGTHPGRGPVPRNAFASTAVGRIRSILLTREGRTTRWRLAIALLLFLGAAVITVWQIWPAQRLLALPPTSIPIEDTPVRVSAPLTVRNSEAATATPADTPTLFPSSTVPAAAPAPSETPTSDTASVLAKEILDAPQSGEQEARPTWTLTPSPTSTPSPTLRPVLPAPTATPVPPTATPPSPTPLPPEPPTSAPPTSAPPTKTPAPPEPTSPAPTPTRTAATPTAPVPPTATPPAATPTPPGQGAVGQGAPAERWIDVNLTTQSLTAYEGETSVYQARVSSGAWPYSTVTGQFRIYLRYEAQTMNGYLLGYDYYLENVPHVQYFFEDYALHGAYWHNNFGTPMSHGCVNLSLADAAWLYEWADIGTLVSVHY